MNLLELQLVVGGVTTILAAIVGASAGAVVASWYQARNFRRAEELKYKRDVLRRFVGNRHKWTGANQTPEEPYTSLNEVFVVFADSPDVISAFNKFLHEADRKDRFHDNSEELVRALADASGVDISNVSNDVISRPIRLMENT